MCQPHLRSPPCWLRLSCFLIEPKKSNVKESKPSNFIFIAQLHSRLGPGGKKNKKNHCSCSNYFVISRECILFAQTFCGGTKTNIILASLPRSIAALSPSQSPTIPNTLLSSFWDTHTHTPTTELYPQTPSRCFLPPTARPPEIVKTLELWWGERR